MEKNRDLTAEAVRELLAVRHNPHARPQYELKRVPEAIRSCQFCSWTPQDGRQGLQHSFFCTYWDDNYGCGRCGAVVNGSSLNHQGWCPYKGVR